MTSAWKQLAPNWATRPKGVTRQLGSLLSMNAYLFIPFMAIKSSTLMLWVGEPEILIDSYTVPTILRSNRSRFRGCRRYSQIYRPPSHAVILSIMGWQPQDSNLPARAVFLNSGGEKSIQSRCSSERQCQLPLQPTESQQQGHVQRQLGLY